MGGEWSKKDARRANAPPHHPFFVGKGKNKGWPFEPIFRTPLSRNSHRLEGSPSVELQWTAGKTMARKN